MSRAPRISRRLASGSPPAACALALLLLAVWTPSAPAQPDLGALTRETQQQYQDDSSFEIVWWVPIDIWAALMRSSPTSRDQSPGLDLLSDYLVFFVAEADLSPLGSIQFRTAEHTREHFRVLDREDTAYEPLPDDQIPADLRVVLRSMLPAIASGAGPVAESFRPLVFPARDKSGRPLALPRQPGELRARLNGRLFRWRLPLASLLPKKRCPVDGEPLSGAFRYCPYHGNELEPSPED